MQDPWPGLKLLGRDSKFRAGKLAAWPGSADSSPPLCAPLPGRSSPTIVPVGGVVALTSAVQGRQRLLIRLETISTPSATLGWCHSQGWRLAAGH